MIQLLTHRLSLPIRAVMLVLAAWLALSSQVASAAVYPLEIIQPRAGLTTANRYYKAYPGLVYDVNISAIGGRFPYTYALANAPSGMTIDSATGRITWPNPTAQASAYAVSARVTDAAGATQTVNWTVLVTTDGFRFLDATNGRTAAQGGDGSRANPWRSVADFYGNKYETTYRNTFLYFRNGTYRIADAPIEDGTRMAVVGSNKPMVWMAYPGETPVLDTNGSHIAIYSGSTNWYMDGFTVQNFTTKFGVGIESAGENVVFRRNNFRNLPAGSGGTGSNASAIMVGRSGVGRYWSFLDNQFSGIYDVGYGILGYTLDRVLVERNRFTDFTVSESKAIGPKMGNSMWFIRDNRINIASGQGIWVDTYASGSDTTHDIEISYNLVQVNNGYSLWIGQEPAAYGAMTLLRNTFVGAQIAVDNLTSGSGPVSFDRDVIVNNSTATNKMRTSGSPSMTNVLTGTLSSGIVDSSGNLTGSYTQYVGTRGYQRSGTSTTVPMPPSGLSVQ